MVSTELIFENMKRFERDFASNLLNIVRRLRPFECEVQDGRGAVPTEMAAGFSRPEQS
jgi:hypothetical protein